MAAHESIQLDIQQYRLNAIFARRADNPVEAAGWDAEADALEARLIQLSNHG